MTLHRIYFLVVSGFTAWVGFFGFFRPQEVLRALPWPVPPLHARVIGAVYLSATLFLLLSVLARSRLQVRTIVAIALVWTGWLLAVSLLHWRSFDFAREQVWFWAVAYLTFPIAAAGLAWPDRGLDAPNASRITQPWVTLWLGVQGATLTGLGMLLALWPSTMAGLWPWKLTPFLAQVYSGPVLGYGIGSLLLARRRNWPETIIPTIGMLTFAALALLGSAWHLALFEAGSPSRLIWFGTLFALAAMSLAVSVAGARRLRRAP